MPGIKNFGEGTPLLQKELKKSKKKKSNEGKIIGENTGEIKEDDKGKYALIQETSTFANEGDTVRFTPNTPTDGTYIEGGDYKGTKKGKTIKIDKAD